MSYPDPEPGLVISYSFLWSHEATDGLAEGRKNRPCAIVVSAAPDPRVPERRRVVVLPITHTPPADPAAALELPPKVKRHLGLDDSVSWVVLDELNVFVWPGFDLRQVPGKPGQYAYGFLPPRLLDELRRRLHDRRVAGQLRAVRRE